MTDQPRALLAESVPNHRVVVLKTAQALGLTIPPTLLVLADEVIK